MNNSSAIRAGEAFVEISADDEGFKKQLDKTSGIFRAWGESLSRAGARLLTVGTALTASLLGATKLFASMGSELALASQKTGITAEELSKLRFAAEHAGVSVESLMRGMERMSKTLLASAEGSKEANQTLDDLGLTIAELSKLSPAERFIRLADAISRVPDPTARTALTMRVFGRQAADLLPLLNQGKDGVAALMRECESLGLVISTEDANAARAFSQDLRTMWDVLRSTAFVIGGTLDPLLKAQIKLLTTGSQVVRDFLRANQGIITGVRIGASLITFLGGALYGVGKAADYVGPAFGALKSILGIVEGALGAIAAGISAALSPLGLLTIGIAGAAIALFKFTNIGATIGAYLGRVFGALKEDALEAFGGIQDAIAAGDWKTAAEILWTMLKIEWTRGVNQLKAVWAEVKFAAVETFADLSDGVQSVWSYLLEYLSSWDGVKAGAQKFLTWLVASFQSAFDHVADFIADTFGTTARSQAAANIDQINKTMKRELAKVDARTDLTAEEKQALKSKIAHAALDAANLESASAKTYDDSARKKRDDDRRRQYDADQKRIDDEFAAKQPGAVDAGEAARREIEAARDKARREHEEELRKRLDEARDPEELNRLKAQLDALRMEAYYKSRTGTVPAWAQTAQTARGGLDDYMKQQAAGTFNKSALFGFGAGSTMDKIERNTRDTANAVKKINFTGQASENFDFGRFG